MSAHGILSCEQAERSRQQAIAERDAANERYDLMVREARKVNRAWKVAADDRDEARALVEQMRETLEAISDVHLDESLPDDVACQQARIQMQNLARAGLRLRAVPARNEDARAGGAEGDKSA